MNYAATALKVAAKIKAAGQPATLKRSSSLSDPTAVLTVDATAKTISRASGSWLDDGFGLGSVVTFAGFAGAANNAAHTVTLITASTLTFGGSTLTDEASAYGVSAEAVTQYACDVLEQFVNSIASYASSLVEGALIAESSRFFYLTAATPRVNDRLAVGSAEFSIEAIRPLSPGTTVIMYMVRAKA